jgi:hypothetical protein
VDGHEDDGKVFISSSIELDADLLVIGEKDLPSPRFNVRRSQVLVSRDESPLTVSGDGVWGGEWSIAVDHKSRIGLPCNESIKRGPQLLRNMARADIPGDMAGKLLR